MAGRSRPGLKDIDDALEIRRRMLLAFEAAEREADPARRQALLTFVIVGGGPTGVELAGALGEIARDALVHDFRAIDSRQARIVLLEAGPRVLAAFAEPLSAAAARELAARGVEVRTGHRRHPDRARPRRGRAAPDRRRDRGVGGRGDRLAARPLARRPARPGRPGPRRGRT